MEKPRPSTLAWGAVIGGVTAYEVMCRRGETLSERLDPILERPAGRAALYTAIGVTSLHLCNLLPKRLDPFGRASEYLNKLKGDEYGKTNN